MSSAELKLEMFRKIDALEKSKIKELYGLFLNYINGKNDLSEWEKLTPVQQKGILSAVKQIDEGKGIAHKKVVSQIRKKYDKA